jgi:alpha-N-arabinofuranosidase
LEVNGPTVKAKNDFDKHEVKTVAKEAIEAKGNVLTYSFPAHSFTQLKAKVKH